MEQISIWMQVNALWLLLALGTVGSFSWLMLMRKRLKMKWYAVALLAVLHTLYGVFTVKAFAFLENGFDTDTLGNMSLFGGVFLMPVAYGIGAKIFKRKAKTVFDIFTPCMVFTLLCARINCIVAGCCQGLLIPGLDGLRYPTRELEILFYIVLLCVICPRIFRGKTNGEIYPLYMISYGIFRFMVEFFRDAGTSSLFHLGHLWALISLIFGISIYVEIKFIKSKRKEEGKQ